MTLLLDGYNVLFAAGILGKGLGPGGLQRARLALLNLLAESLDAETLGRTTVVFDARDPPPDRPRAYEHRGLQVRFAVGPEGADAVIEELIRADSAPRQLIVVSSDHRLQRAARRRKATAIDSDRWYGDLLRERARRRSPAASADDKPPAIEYSPEALLREFGYDLGERPPADEFFPPEVWEDLAGEAESD